MRILASVLLLAIAVPAVAQERAIRSANLPRDLEWEILRMYDGHAERYDGPATIGRLEVVRGDVAVMGGPFRIAGRVMGNVAMVDGDVIIEEGGSVTGDITVIGGEVRMADDVDVRGTITTYATSSRRYEDDEDRWDDWDDRDRWEPRRSSRGFSRLTLRTGASYNRVEGLPLMFGPVLQTEGRNPLRLEALAIWRSEAGASLDTDRMGYQVRAEQFMFDRRFSIGASAYSVVDPMDRWQITDLEASLATALFHEDYRDHYDREGWSAFATVEPVRGLEARVEYRQEAHATVAPGDPWSLFDGGDLWRLQPIVGQGDIQLVSGALELDLRDDDDDPERGWLARVTVDHPVGGTLTRPSLLFVRPEDGTVVSQMLAAEELGTDFTAGLIDIRRYMRVSRGSQINLRVAAGGAFSERALPPQFQHALGGLGTLPGFPVFSADCGARGVTGRYESTRFYTRYGCDRFALGQVEYRGGLSLDFGFGEPDYEDEDWWDDIDIDLSPTWVVFFDAAQGWAYDDALTGAATDTGILYDAGVGFLVDDLGFYVALPLNGEVEQEPRFFVRLGRRF
jgi:hypothetical protein